VLPENTPLARHPPRYDILPPRNIRNADVSPVLAAALKQSKAEAEAAGTELPLSEIIGALSHALDLTEGQPEGHCIRCCWIGTAIGREIGMSTEELGELYYVLLLKDVGCSSNAARISALYQTNDLTFKRDAKIMGQGVPSAVRFVLTHTAPDAGIAERHARFSRRCPRASG
jgi:hypothetical protein